MIVGTGIDLEDVHRIRAAIERHGDHFIKRIYTPAEVAYVESKKNRFERYTARFAAKEAGMKALGTGMQRGVFFRDFEVRNDLYGLPELHLSGRAAEISAQLGVRSVRLSLTHTATQGMAIVILET